MTPRLFLLPLLLVAAGCQLMEAPEGYVKLDHPGRRLLRAVSPDDCRLTLRRVDCDGEGSPAFWGRAVRNQLEVKLGYRLISEQGCRTASGRTGTELLFATGAGEAEQLYLVALYPERTFLGGSGLLVAEAGGARETLTRDLPAIRTALATIR